MEKVYLGELIRQKMILLNEKEQFQKQLLKNKAIEKKIAHIDEKLEEVERALEKYE